MHFEKILMVKNRKVLITVKVETDDRLLPAGFYLYKIK